MARYLARNCPRCKDYVGVVIREPLEPVTEIPIEATCLRSGHKLPFLKIILGNTRLEREAREQGRGLWDKSR